MSYASAKESWQDALSDLVTDPEELIRLLALEDTALLLKQPTFPLRIPRSYLKRIEKNNPNDPLLLQFLPQYAETLSIPGYEKDPLKEKNVNPIPGLLHKYPNRVLVTLTSSCAIHCRYCFRRHFPYAENNPGKKGWEAIFAYLKERTNIDEVILSGGDPLVVTDKLLQQFVQGLTSINHIKRLRIHTRVLTLIPERVTQSLLNWIESLSLSIIIVIHVNHAREVSEDVKEKLLLLRKKGVILFNQSVLLKGINDNVEALATLSETLFASGVIPYYLHVLDRVEGVAHFDLKISEIKKIYQDLSNILPGYLLPKLVREEPGKLSKTSLFSDVNE